MLRQEFVLPTSSTFNYTSPRAKDRRACVRQLFGSWFDDNGLKLTRDYMVTFANRSIVAHGKFNFGYEHFAVLEIHDPTKALLFKLTWGGR